MKTLRIGTRGSQLALWQARTVATALESMGACAELVIITTHGDRRQDVPLTTIGGKGVFVKEIHEALMSGTIDLAVHSAKDMPAVSPEGLTIAATLKREDPRDALVFPMAPHKGAPYETPGYVGPGFMPGQMYVGPGFMPGQISQNARIGTGSPRRIAQLRRLFPQATFEPIRGNVDTRLRKLDAGEVDALVLACAGLRRLGFADRISTPLDVTACLPAPGQGIVAVETRRDDERIIEILRGIDHGPSHAVLSAEQAVVAELGGGCQLPLGAFAELQGDVLSIRAVVASADGRDVIDAQTQGTTGDPVDAGTRLARDLASRGARELLRA
ncbi:MAG TPA: hydroxymethylbilane synthase [Vicinamibacterales bacterium]